MQLNWDDLKVVLAVGRAGSLTRAAQQLGIDQSTAGRRLSAVEAALGVVLFLRSKTGFAPTEAGEQAIARAIEIESRALLLAESLSDGGQGPAGAVQLVGPPWVLARLAHGPLQSLLSRHPQLQVNAIAGPRPPMLASGEPVVALSFDKTPQETEFAVKLGEIAYALYAPRGAADGALDWLALAEDDSGQGAPERWLQRLRGEGGALRLTANCAGVVLAALHAGLGRGLLPVCVGDGDPRLERLEGGGPDLARTLYMHVHPDTVQTARLQATMAWLRESFGPAFAAP
jgi:DNA-binding transcriptional LysR family regulator